MTTSTSKQTTQDKRLTDGPDWTFELLQVYLDQIDRVAKHYRLDTYPHQIEVITSEQMMDAYSSIGMPINYTHWSFGKKFIETEQKYKYGQQGLAYEIVINSNPCIAYLMEENTITMQALVMAHACTDITPSLRITIYSARGLTPAPSWTTYSLPATILMSVKSAMALKRLNGCSILVMR